MNRTFTYLLIGGIATLFCYASVSGQTSAESSVSQPDAPLSQTVNLDKGQKQDLIFNVRETGPITVQVLLDAEMTTGTSIGEVKLSITSMDPGFETWIIEQFMHETGSYTFELLRPGKYKIEVASTKGIQALTQ
jgi:hypothetical protein